MRVRAIKTHKITDDRDLYAVLDRHLDAMAERSILAITSNSCMPMPNRDRCAR